MKTSMRDWRASARRLPLGSAHPVVERTFRQAEIPAVRRLAAEFGTRAGIRATRLADFVLAVNEAAACAVAGGPLTARLRMWTTGARAFCTVTGDSVLHLGPGDGRQGDVDALRQWLLHQLCDYASVESGPDGVAVLLSVSVI